MIPQHEMDNLDATALERFAGFADLIAEYSSIHNLTSITDPVQIRHRHFEDSLAVLPHLEDLAVNGTLRLVDVGSGAGFPGLALAIARPFWHVLSLEATGKKADFQSLVVEKLGLTNVTILNRRAEDIGIDPRFRERYDAGTARAVGKLNLLAELVLPLVKVGGRFFAWKSKGVEAEISEAREAMKILGGSNLQQLSYCIAGKDEPVEYQLIRAEKSSKTPAKYPREFKLIRGKPLGISPKKS